MNSIASTKLKVSFAILSGVMLGLSFPPFETGVFAAAAFVLFFILFDYIESYRESFLYSYLTFFVFNLITLFWAGGFTHGKDLYLMVAGFMLLVAHPMFFCVPVLVWAAFRRQFGYKAALYTFPFFWVAFEYTHAHTEVSFPWLILGNSQTYDLAAIQFASFTGAYGISFWLLCLNVLLYILYVKISVKDWKVLSFRTIAAGIGILLLYLLPKFYGNHVLNVPATNEQTSLRVGIVQPNIDPFVNWERNADPQISILQKLTNEVVQQQVDLVLWPETAVPFYILSENNLHYFNVIKHQVDSLGIHLLTGIPDIVYYRAGDVVPKSSKTAQDGQRYDSFNSSMLLIPNSNEVQKYAKMLLVPFAERVPFSEELSFLNAMQWNFGLGGWNFGKEATVFSFRTNTLPDVKFSNMICYESVYPGFVANFVKKGAQFLTVITNDSWWGNTSGAYQHKQIAVLRAVENRRWIIQCANGGISCFIDPFGHIVQPTSLYTQAIIAGDIEPKTELTFYSKNGDWFAELCFVLSAFLLAATLGKKFYMNIRTRQMNEVH